VQVSVANKLPLEGFISERTINPTIIKSNVYDIPVAAHGGDPTNFSKFKLCSPKEENSKQLQLNLIVTMTS
jgi:hypothetical protein